MSGPGDCFISGTKVLLSDYSYKNIEDINTDDIVMSYNVETNKLENKKVIYTYDTIHTGGKNDYTITIKFDDNENHNTFTNPYWVIDKGWSSYNPEQTYKKYNLDTKQLEVADKCLFYKDDVLIEREILSIEEWFDEVHTYNFHVENNNNYFANNILVHNKRASLGVEDAVTISGSLNVLERKSHASMSVGDTVLAASIVGLPDTDEAAEFLLWEYTGSDIASQITLVTASIESLTPSSHSEWLIVDCDNGRDDTFKITENHPLLAKSESMWAFEYMGDIDVTYKLVSSSLEEVSINSITATSSSEDEDFMRFDIEPQDTYFADDILVHN